MSDATPPSPLAADIPAHREDRSSWNVALAITSLAAGAIHFAVTGDHFREDILVGVFFAVVAWGQSLWAVGMLASGGRRLLLAGAVGNLAVVAVWAASRTIGVPVGPEPWTAEAVGRADLASTALELLIVAGCVLLLASRPRGSRVGGATARPRRQMPVAVYGLALAVLTSSVIATAGEHSHAGVNGGAEAAHADGESHGHATVGGPTSSMHSGPPHIHHEEGHEAGAPNAEQLDSIRAAMERYQDVDAALAEGFERMDGDYPETGAHFGIPEWTDGGAYSITGDLDLAHPEYLMYTKRLTGTWKLVAVAYVLDIWAYPEPPTDLVGAPYHEHVWNCIEPAGWTLDEEEYGFVSRDECVAMGNTWSPGGEWMTHVWLIPNPEGVFADWNPTIV